MNCELKKNAKKKRPILSEKATNAVTITNCIVDMNALMHDSKRSTRNGNCNKYNSCFAVFSKYATAKYIQLVAMTAYQLVAKYAVFAVNYLNGPP